MADVRLTATNPEDSSVVPVACNAKGELKLEEIPDQSFDGNLDGNLTVTGSASFAGDVTLRTSTADTDWTPALVQFGKATGGNSQGVSMFSSHRIRAGNQYAYMRWGYCSDGNGDANDLGSWNMYASRSTDADIADEPKIQLQGNGQAMFASGGFSINKEGRIAVERTDGGTDKFAVMVYGAESGVSFSVKGNGETVFAGNKAGFTRHGYLWCTTRRGDTVILNATSNGMGLWEPYDPPVTREEIKNEWSEKNVIRPKPEESSQDGTETTQ